MIPFSTATTTAFRLARRLLMGTSSTSMYLLIHEEATRSAVEADLQAELEVEMANPRPIEPISELLDVSDISELASESPIRVFRISRWSPKLVPLLDTHVTRLERTGAQFLFLTTSAIAEQLLVESPNFRNRLTDVLRVIPEDLTGGASY